MIKMKFKSGIEEESVALQKELQCKVNLTAVTPMQLQFKNTRVITLTKGSRLLIGGIALAEGIWKGTSYIAEELKKTAKRLLGKPVKVEHMQNTLFKNKTVGKVTEAYYDESLKSILFKAEITDSKAIELVKDGTFSAVSVSSVVDKFPINDSYAVGFNYDFNELSLVEDPACDYAQIVSKEELSRSLGLSKVQSSKEVGEVVLKNVNSNEELEQVEIVKLTQVECPKLYTLIQLNSVEDFTEDVKSKTVSYYYGCLNPYLSQEGLRPLKRRRLFAIMEVGNSQDILELSKQVKVLSAFYGYNGIPNSKVNFVFAKEEPDEKEEEEVVEEVPEEETPVCPIGEVWDEVAGKCVPIKEEDEEEVVVEDKVVTLPTEKLSSKQEEPVNEEAPVTEVLEVVSETPEVKPESVNEVVTETPVVEAPVVEDKPVVTETPKPITPVTEVKPVVEAPITPEPVTPVVVKEEPAVPVTVTTSQPVVEAPAVEPIVTEERKLTEEEIKEYVKSHWEEFMLKLAKEKKF